MRVGLAQVFRDAAEKAALSSNGTPSATAASNSGQEPDGPIAAGTVSLQELIGLHGDASTAVLLFLLALFSTISTTGMGSIISLAIFALAWRWGRQVETTTVHSRVGNIRLSRVWTARGLNFLAWLYEKADIWLEPRLFALSERSTRPWWAVWICVMGAIIFLPIPLGNILPSLSLVVLSLAWIFKDGITLLISVALGMAALVYSAYFGQLAWQIVVQSTQWLVRL